MKAVSGLLAAVILCLTGMGLVAYGQESRITEHSMPRSQPYIEAQGYARLQTDLIYIDQLEGEIPMDGAPRYQPPEPEKDPGESEAVELSNQVLLGLIIAVAIWLMWKFGRPVLARWGLISPELRRRDPAPAKPHHAPVAPDPDLITRLRRMKDREAALIALVQAVLPVAADSNGLRLTRSETARELLRRLPGSWPHLPALRRIVMTEELVQFGGRPLEEQSFLDCLDRAVPILNGGRS